ncbi:hypothetical protein RKD48_007552 [Streptomyces ambofaciens]
MGRRDTGRRDQVREPVGQPLQDAVGTGTDVHRTGVLGQDVAGQVEHRGAGVPGLQVEGDDRGVAGVEGDPVRGASAGGGARAVAQPPGTVEQVEALSDGGAGQTGRLLEVGPRVGAAAADQVQQFAGAGLT